ANGVSMLKVDEVLDKGLTNFELLTEDEWLIFVVAYIEIVADMEGWDHFFTYNMDWYPVLVKSLQLSGDDVSLEILQNYEQHFANLKVSFDAKSIDTFLASASSRYLNSCPDWRELFSDAAEQRWLKIEAYFRSHGVKICT
ncbi:hypothetical protein ACM6VE_004580, partial [Vibrio parahaemolyticus]